MTFKGWLIEHSVELASLIVTILGFLVVGNCLIKITSIFNFKAQNKLLINQNGDNNHIGNINQGLNEQLTSTQPNIKEETNNKKELIKKLENFLDENKPVSTLASIAFRIANELKMSKDIEWLSNEVNGFKDNLNNKNRGLKFKKAREEDKHRSIVAELNLEFKDGKMESLQVPLFISQSIYDVENWVSQLSAAIQGMSVLRAPPPQLMVDELNVDPNERVPYIISKSSLDKIINGVRLKIIDFLQRTKEKVNG